MRQYGFRAQVTLDPTAHVGLMRGLPSRTHALTTRTCFLIEPSYHEYFPAVISRVEELPLRPGVHVVVSIALAADEAEASFAPGQRFTIWSDAVVGHTIWPDGLVGYGVISRPNARAA